MNAIILQNYTMEGMSSKATCQLLWQYVQSNMNDFVSFIQLYPKILAYTNRMSVSHYLLMFFKQFHRHAYALLHSDGGCLSENMDILIIIRKRYMNAIFELLNEYNLQVNSSVYASVFDPHFFTDAEIDPQIFLMYFELFAFTSDKAEKIRDGLIQFVKNSPHCEKRTTFLRMFMSL